MSAPDLPPGLVEVLPITQTLVMEVLAARWRTGEDHWTFPTKATPAVRRLEELGLVRWKSGIVERTILVWMTDAGRSAFLSDDWTPPAAMVEHLGLTEETRARIQAEVLREAEAEFASRTQEAAGAVREHWRGQDFVDGQDTAYDSAAEWCGLLAERLDRTRREVRP